MGSSTGRARQPDKIGDSLANRATYLFSKPGLRRGGRPSEPVHQAPSGYAKAFRFAKEFGPDQVLRSDNLKFQGSPTPKPEGDQKNYRGQDRKHGDHDNAVGAILQCLQGTRNYEERQPEFELELLVCKPLVSVRL